MAPAIIYLLVFSALIIRNGFFGFFRDDKIRGTRLAFVFLLKCLAIPVFCFVYQRIYGGIEKFDAGIFFNDARALNNLAWLDPGEFLKAMLGMQDDNAGSYFYNHYTIYTHNWDNGRTSDFFYNDNRVVIRLHALLHFIACDSYFVQALFSCFLSYAGLFLIYRSFAVYFEGSEYPLLLVFCLFPALWFYTGAVLKESLVMFVMGNAIFVLRRLAQGHYSLPLILWLMLMAYIAVFLKPYILCYALFCFGLYFFVSYSEKIKYKALVFFAVMFVVIYTTNALLERYRQRSLKELALAGQQVFSNASKGGLFLQDRHQLIRLEDNMQLVTEAGEAGSYVIRKGVSYIYWEHSHQQDTLFCRSNEDTVTRYQLLYRMKEGGSNIPLSAYNGGSPALLFSGLYYSLFYPMFFNAQGALQLIASLENLAILLSLLLALTGFFWRGRSFLPLVFLFFALSLCLLIGITTPNSGAIFRYRSPAAVFILAAALYHFQLLREYLFKIRN